MDDFLANKIIEDMMIGKMSAKEAWKNLLEASETISDEKHDEITALITEQLLETEAIEEDDDVDLENIFTEEDIDNFYDYGWDCEPYPHDEGWEIETKNKPPHRNTFADPEE